MKSIRIGRWVGAWIPSLALKIKVCIEFEGLIFFCCRQEKEPRSSEVGCFGKAEKPQSGALATKRQYGWRFGSTKQLGEAGLAEHSGILSAWMLLNVVTWDSEIGLPLSPELLGIRRAPSPSVLLSAFCKYTRSGLRRHA